MTSSAEIQPVSRALDVLEQLNKRPVSTLKMLHAQTGYPKSSLVRVLYALTAAGYVEQVAMRGGYRTTARVLNLSGGFSERDRVVDAAEAPMRAFTAVHRWPVTLATYAGQSMRMRFTTTKDSPLSPDRAAGSASLPMLDSALGRAYLAFCPKSDRALILKVLAQSSNPRLRAAREPEALERLFATVRRNGYAVTGPIAGDRGLGLALPVIKRREVLAALTMRIYRSSMSEAEAVRRYMPALRQLVADIVRALD